MKPRRHEPQKPSRSCESLLSREKARSRSRFARDKTNRFYPELAVEDSTDIKVPALKLSEQFSIAKRPLHPLKSFPTTFSETFASEFAAGPSRALN